MEFYTVSYEKRDYQVDKTLSEVYNEFKNDIKGFKGFNNWQFVEQILKREPSYGNGKGRELLGKEPVIVGFDFYPIGAWLERISQLYDENRIPGLTSRLVILGLCENCWEFAEEINKDNFLHHLRREAVIELDNTAVRKRNTYESLLSPSGLKSWKKRPWAAPN